MSRPEDATAPRVPARDLLALAALSAGILGYEVALTRMIAVRHWHHLVPVVIALALLGFGVAGAWVALRRARGEGAGSPAAGATWFAVAVPAAVGIGNRIPLDLPALAWHPAEAIHLLLVAAVLFLPFFAGGVVVASLFARAPSEAGRIYGANLLGSAAGSLGALLCLDGAGLPGTLAASAGTGALAAALFSRGRRRGAASALAPGLAIVAAARLGLLGVVPDASKPLPTVLLARGVHVREEIDTARSRLTVVAGEPLHAMPGLSLRSTAAIPPQQHLFLDGDDAGPLFLSTLGAESRGAFTEVLAAVPFVLRPGAVAVVSGPGAGFSAWVAEANGADSVTVIEPDPGIVELLVGGSPASGAPRFLPPSARASTRDLRRWAAAVGGADVIQVAVGTPSVGGVSEAIAYDVTREGIDALVEALRPGGILALSAPLEATPHAALRLAATAADVLRVRGRVPREHVAAVRDWNQVLLLVSRDPWSGEDLAGLRRFAEAYAFDLSAAPGLRSEERNRFHRMQSGLLDEGLSQVLGEAPEGFTGAFVLDVTPTTDDRPFFHHRVKPERWRDLVEAAGRDWPRQAGWGYLLSWISLLAVGAVGLVISMLPLGLHRAAAGRAAAVTEPRSSHGRQVPIAYFVLVGLGFMGMEIAFLGKSRLCFDAMTPTFAAVVTAVLVGAGLGSRFLDRRRGGFFRSGGAAALAGVAGAGGVLALEAVSGSTIGPLASKSAAVLVTLGAGFFLGMPFPAGLAGQSGAGPAAAARAFAVNGVASVAGSLLATLVAMHAGYRVLAVVSLTAYLLAAWGFRRFLRLIPGKLPA